MPNSKQDWNLLGLTLSREVNVLALMAFLMSLVSIGVHVWQYLEGAQINLRVGERVNILFRAHPAQPETPILMLNARLSYTNTGAVGRDGIIVNERVIIRFGDDPADVDAIHEYLWLHFEVFLPQADGSALAQVKDTAHDFVVPGASAASHQTTFVGFRGAQPHNQAPDITTDPVIELDFQRLIRTSRKVTLLFISEDIDGNTYQSSCKLAITKEVIAAIKETEWATVLCGKA